jgi:aryl-alcohol dehydrogenase-like predicted oxidoreductase
MEYRDHGRTRLQVAARCLGTMPFGWTTDEASFFAIRDAFRREDGNFIDTANLHTT